MVTPGMDPQGHAMDPRKIQEHFEDFYEDLFEELSKHGEIESLNVCDNLADHMVGNVYVQFREEEHAAAALRALTGRFYAGRPIIVDFSPVTDFREATCRQYEENTCNRGGYCNFMHLKKISRELRRQLFGRYRRYYSHSRSRRGMMTEIIMMIAMVEGHGAEVQAIDEAGAGVAAPRGTEVQSEEEVLRGEPRLNSGTEKENKLQQLRMLMCHHGMEMDTHTSLVMVTSYSSHPFGAFAAGVMCMNCWKAYSKKFWSYVLG
ncbi:hypothetical protein SUGI_0977920 [Cryptomeria japonica]|nr:hypothetical protein SUGI_0977920 [Cryptomeria japonica]